MVIIYGHDEIPRELALYTEAKAVGKGRAKTAVNTRRKNLCRNGSVGQSTEWSPEKEAGRLADSHARLIHKLLRRQPRQGLNIGNIDDRVRRNLSVSRGHNSVQSINADK